MFSWHTARRVLKSLLVVSCFGVFGTSPSGAAEQGDDVLVVVNANNPQQSLSTDDIRSIFLGKKKFWEGQLRVVPLTRQAKHAASDTFFDKVIKMNANRYSLFWRKRALAGKGTEPKSVAEGKALLEKVAGQKGAIGYVLRSEYAQDKIAGLRIVATIPAK